ncbi:hypothetical protein KR009_006170 [Drosophila setifemur]|nr:hypothetical protein KR009_006170 [Drosophila setifemur]
MSWNQRNTSHISIYNYPEHLNPFYEDDNHKRLRFWGLLKKKNNNERHSLSIGNLQEFWKSYSFRKKKSSTLGINKTSESPPTLRRDFNDNSYLNSRVFRGDRHTSMQNIDSRRESTLSGMYFNRNNRSRSTTQFSGYSSPTHQNIRSSQTSLTSTNPFNTEPESCPSSPMSSKRYRKKRRAPPPPKPVGHDYLATKDIESLASEIEQFVNNKNESLINPDSAKEVDKLNSEPHNKSEIIDLKQANGTETSTYTDKKIVPAIDSDTKVCIRTLKDSDTLSSDIEPQKVTALNPTNVTSCTSTSQCNAIHIMQANETKILSTDRIQNGNYCTQHKENTNIKKLGCTVLVSNSKMITSTDTSLTDNGIRETRNPNNSKMGSQAATKLHSENDSIPSTSKAQQPIDNNDEHLVSKSEQKTNSFGTVKQISQIFEENISCSVPSKVYSTSSVKTAKENNLVSNIIQSNVSKPGEDLQIREEFELDNPVRFDNDGLFLAPVINDRHRLSMSPERDSNARCITPTPHIRKKKSIKEVLESISRNQMILNESAAKGTKVYLTPSYAENIYNYPNELNSVNSSSKEVTSANISVSVVDTNELPPKNNLFISKITKVKGQYRESSPTSSNLDWNPLPKPNRANHLGNSSHNFSNGK